MELRLFPQHTGIWEGTYTRIAPDGSTIHKHKSRLTLKLIGNIWWQSNLYHFEDGRTEFHNFGASQFDDQGVMTFDNHRIFGKSWESNDNILLWWEYKEEPGTKLFEIITLLGDGHRMRTWQHSRDGVFEGLTMIEERRVATQDTIPDAHYQQESYVKVS